MKENGPVFNQVLAEQEQSHNTRKGIYEKLEKQLGKPVLAYFTSFSHPVMIEDSDADILEGILQRMDLSKGLALIINSPGGDGLTSERIIRACRSYSETGEYSAIVPNKAKSAATMVCFGSSEIVMGPTSELGPIDPQIVINDQTVGSVYNVIKSYEDLFTRAIACEGHLEPYLQQLSNYDEKEIAEYKMLLSLSEDIAIKTLANGMMKGANEDEIKSKIKIFLTPEQTKTHGRPIYRDEARSCGLNINQLTPTDDRWKSIYELYIRLNNYVTRKYSKCIENCDQSFVTDIPKGGKT